MIPNSKRAPRGHFFLNAAVPTLFSDLNWSNEKEVQNLSGLCYRKKQLLNVSNVTRKKAGFERLEEDKGALHLLRDPMKRLQQTPH